jgi:hypothetical protein
MAKITKTTKADNPATKPLYIDGSSGFGKTATIKKPRKKSAPAVDFEAICAANAAEALPIIPTPSAEDKLAALYHEQAEAERWAYEAEESATALQTPAEALASVRTYDDFQAWAERYPNTSLYRRSCGNAVASWGFFGERGGRDIIAFKLANGQKSYPFVALIHKYFNTL